MKFALPVFSVAFVVIYAFAVDFNLALFTYHPQLNEVAFLVERPKTGPAMYWYGWIATSALGAMMNSMPRSGMASAGMGRGSTPQCRSTPIRKCRAMRSWRSALISTR